MPTLGSTLSTATIRETLTAARTYYVATTGADTNDGLTAGTPFLTIQRAVDVAASLDSSTYNVTISVADGTYTTAQINLKTMVGSGTITIAGNSTTPANVVIQTTTASGTIFYANNVKTTYLLSGMTLLASGVTGSAAIRSDINSLIYYGKIVFGANMTYHLFAGDDGIIICNNSYDITGGATYHWYAQVGGKIKCQGINPVTITGTPNFSGAFAYATKNATMLLNGNTFSGSATGIRYTVTLNAVVDTIGATLPGNSAGSTATGGQYA